MESYLKDKNKVGCYGCEACAQICPVSAITMREDEELFRYPEVDDSKCLHCNLCLKVCPAQNKPIAFDKDKYVFGGHNVNSDVLNESTSGGAFSAIAESWCDENYVIFGALSDGLRVYHSYITDKADLYKFRRSKYSQSRMGTAYKDAKAFLKEGKKVLFSGTPCQIAGLINYLGNCNLDKLLTCEVVCEGVPTPHYINRLNEHIEKKYGSAIETLDYRYKDMKSQGNPNKGKWDFQVMQILLKNGRKIKKDRWLNPFWSVWLQHLMSRPSCYECPFAMSARTADISMGDLWGVHIYCPELYNKNAGASLVVCNTPKGTEACKKAERYMEGHELSFETALKYQGPMRNHIKANEDRDEFMKDVTKMDYTSLNKKWAKKPSAKLLWQKYVWGNRQKVWLWNLKNRSEN